VTDEYGLPDGVKTTVLPMEGYVFQGWEMIGASVGVSARTARRMANRDRDPLPVRVRLGRAILRLTDWQEWIERHASRPLADTRTNEAERANEANTDTPCKPGGT